MPVARRDRKAVHGGARRSLRLTRSTDQRTRWSPIDRMDTLLLQCR